MSELPKGQDLGGLPGWVGWLRRRLLPGGADALMIAAHAILLTALISFILTGFSLAPLAYYTTIICLSAMVVLQVLWKDLQQQLGQARAFGLHFGLSAALYLVASLLSMRSSGSIFLPFVLFMLTAQSIVALPWRIAAAYAALITLGWFGVIWLLGSTPAQMLASLISIGLSQAFTVTFSRVVVLFEQQTARAQALADELRAANAALAAAHERERELSAVEERLRLARDIHDGLGHYLTVLNVQLQAAARLIERDPPRAAEVIAACRGQAQAAMAEVRRSVAAMRQSPLGGRPLPEAIGALVADFARAASLEAAFRCEGDPLDPGPAAALTIYRAAQEGLTNAQKHASAGHVAITLSFAPDSLALRVRDDGPSAPDPQPAAAGFGLAGLRERVSRLGGAFSAGPQPGGGFLLEIRLPL